MKKKTFHQSQFGTERRFGTQHHLGHNVVLGQIPPFYSMLVQFSRRMGLNVVLGQNVVLV